MKARFLNISAWLVLTAAAALAAAPAVIVVTPPPANVIKVTGQNPPSITITRPVTDVVTVVTPGMQGPKGADGTTGPAGSPGATGVRGYDGREVEVQNNGTHIQWRYIADPPVAWTDLVPLSAISGTNGTNGANGTDGKTVLSSSGVPANGLGVDGDFCVDTANAHFYGPKAAGAWPETYIDLVGPQGPAGPEGPPGALPNQAALYGVIDDPVDGSTMWMQQGSTEQATNAKDGVKDRLGNAKTWRDGNGTVVRQCITGDTAPAFKMIAPDGATVLYSVACDGTMAFTGTVTIR